MERGGVLSKSSDKTLDDLLTHTHILYDETLSFRKEVLADPIRMRLTERTLPLTDSLKVASFYVTLAARVLTPEERKHVYYAVYPHLTPDAKGDAEDLIIQGISHMGYVGFPAFQLIMGLMEAEGSYFTIRGEGFWHPDFVLLITNYVQRLVASRYLLTPEGFAQRLTALSQEVGNTFTITLIDQTRDDLFYEYTHTEEAIRALRRAFPP